MQWFIRKCDRKIRAASFRHGHVSRDWFHPQRADNVAARDDADKLILLIHNQSSLTPVEIGITAAMRSESSESFIVAGMVGTSLSITSRTRANSNGSMLYSRVM